MIYQRGPHNGGTLFSADAFVHGPLMCTLSEYDVGGSFGGSQFSAT